MLISGHKCLQRKCLKSNVKNISILRANEIKGKKPEAYTLSPISQGISTELLPTSSYRQVYMETPGISADEEALSLADVMILTAQQHTAPSAHALRPLCVWQRSLSQDGIGSSRVLPNLSHCTCPTHAGFGLLTDRHYPPKPTPALANTRDGLPDRGPGPERAWKARLVPKGAPATRGAAPSYEDGESSENMFPQ